MPLQAFDAFRRGDKERARAIVRDVHVIRDPVRWEAVSRPLDARLASNLREIMHDYYNDFVSRRAEHEGDPTTRPLILQNVPVEYRSESGSSLTANLVVISTLVQQQYDSLGKKHRIEKVVTLRVLNPPDVSPRFPVLASRRAYELMRRSLMTLPYQESIHQTWSVTYVLDMLRLTDAPLLDVSWRSFYKELVRDLTPDARTVWDVVTRTLPSVAQEIEAIARMRSSSTQPKDADPGKQDSQASAVSGPP